MEEKKSVISIAFIQADNEDPEDEKAAFPKIRDEASYAQTAEFKDVRSPSGAYRAACAIITAQARAWLTYPGRKLRLKIEDFEVEFDRMEQLPNILASAEPYLEFTGIEGLTWR